MQFFRHLWNHGSAASATTKWVESHGRITQFKMNDIDGKPFDFKSLAGKAVVITSTACDCGFTKSGYQHLVKWKSELKDEPFEVLAFPSNAFAQETKSPAEIKEYVTENFGLNFPLMEKSDINGDDTNPVYVWLKQSFPGDITWNFSSYFLINHEGIPIQRFEKDSWGDIRRAIAESVTEARKANGTGGEAPKLSEDQPSSD